jgi:hypothetical protein
MEEEAKKSVWEIRIGIWVANGAFVPMLNEKKRLNGKSIPNIREGGFV